MSSAIPYEQQLNPSQLEAVFYTDSPLLVLAGAGSGKTRVITYKIAYLINECNVDPGHILAVTFTNKASNEMKERVESLLGKNVDIWVKTFHSAAARLLRIMGNHFQINSNFSIIDQQDQKALVRKIIKDLKIDPETYKPAKYVYLIERAKDRLLNSDEAFSEDFSTDPVFYDIYRIYEDKLEKENLLDFGDLIFKLVKGLSQNDRALSKLKDRFRFILVDEFQDTNQAQYDLIKKLTMPSGTICVVGDDDQSIYGFRGARIENILSFSKDYKNAKIIKLEENYRSYQTILTASSRLIDNNPGRLGKKLYTKKGEGEKLQFYRASTDYNEAFYIAGQINELTGYDKYSYSDIAVFYRMNAQSRIFESVFSRMRIPYTVIGSLRFYEREEIKDIISYIKLSLNPMDEISLRRIANKPPRGIGQKTVDALIKVTIERGYPFYRIGSDLDIQPSRVSLVQNFLDFFEALRDRVNNSYPPHMLKFLFDESGYLDWLLTENREEKARNLDELYNAVEEFSKNNPSSPVSEFIEEVSLNQAGSDGEDSQNNRVHLITLHNAKGLEFPVVFMAGMEEGTFPHFLSRTMHKDLQEERRLCYVGMTRAMEKLYLTAAEERKLYGNSKKKEISNFIFELPQDLIILNTEEGIEYDSAKPPGRSVWQDSQPYWYHQNRVSPGLNKVKSGSDKTGAEMPDLEVNCRIVHTKFGHGRVLSLERGVALIQFDNGTKIKLMLQYSPIVKETT